MTDKIKELFDSQVSEISDFGFFKAGYLAAQKEASEQEPVAWMAAHTKAIVYHHAKESAPTTYAEFNRPLYAAPVSEAEQQKDAALIEQLASALSISFAPNGEDYKIRNSALAAVEEWRKGK